MPPKALALIAAAAACLMSACSQHQSAAPVPRREAYPRVAEIGSEYSVPDGLPLPFAVNTAAAATVEQRPGDAAWLTIAYPAYGAVAYCTFTPVRPKDLASVIDNRHERMMLNLAGAPAELTELQGIHGSHCAMLVAGSAPQAAVQFLATNPRWVVSGTVQFPDASPSAPTDSLAPMVRAISADILHALKEL